MDDLQRLVATEAVRRTKATYWYALDTKNWPLLATVFGPDSIVDFRGERDLEPGEGIDKLRPVAEALADKDSAVAQGADNIIAFLVSVATPLKTVHHGHAPIIDVLGVDDATAIWPMYDCVESSANVMHGYGFYHETYRRDGARWYIRELVLTRLRMDGKNPLRDLTQP